MNLYKIQLNILKKINNYYKENKAYYVKNIIDNQFYLYNWDKGIGKDYLNFLLGNRNLILKLIITNIKLTLLEIVTEYKILSAKKILYNNKYKYICISWALKDDFCLNGSFKDRYTNTNSRDSKEIIWILINLGKTVPQKIDRNIVLLTKSYSFKNFIYKFFKYLKDFILLRKDEEGMNISIPGYGKYNIIRSTVLKTIKCNNIKSIFTPYEAQPHQLGIFNLINKRFKYIKTVGYIHSCLPPLPTEYFFRIGSPKKLITHGINQKNILIEKLNWEKKNIINSNSLRYGVNVNSLPKNCIYLPYCLTSPNKIIKKFNLLINNDFNFINNKFTIRNHPIMGKSILHLKFKKELEKILDTKKNNIKQNKVFKKCSIVIGASAVVIELIEQGHTVIHITSDPKYDVYSPLIWKGIDVKKLNNSIYIYKIKNKGSYIKSNKFNIKLFNLLESI